MNESIFYKWDTVTYYYISVFKINLNDLKFLE